MLFTTVLPFGPLLKHLRKQAGMTQHDLAVALGYSESLICSLEKALRQPDLQAVSERFIPALGLQADPNLAANLIEQAALARGERPPASVTFQRTIHVTTQAEPVEAEPFDALPAPPTELIGRGAEVNQLCNRLLGHSGRLLTLLGPPGIGKTTLALAVATRLQQHYADGVVFVPLAAVNDPALMAATILASVGSTDMHPPQNKLIAYLRRKSLLLVLDNLEQLLSPPLSGEGSGVGLIANLVAECPGVCILATSRERLHLRAEQRYKVPPLDLAAAVELFVQRAQAVAADFARTPPSQATLETICQRLDCLPLAIELCAAQVELLSLPQLLAQLQEHRLDLLVDGARDLPPRQRTLRTAIERSYRLLTEAEGRLLRSLGVFVGGFDLAAAEAVSAWDQEIGESLLPATLHALISKSLVRADTLPSGEQRFLLLETICEFALEQARVHGEEAILRQRHYAAYLQLFRTGDSHLRGREAAAWLARLTAEQDNLRTALQWNFDGKHYVEAAWLILSGSWFWHLRGQWYERGQWLAQLVPHRQALDADLRLATLVTVYSTARSWEAFQPLERWTDEVMQLLEVSSNKLLQATGWFWLAIFYTDSAADFLQATVAWEQSIRLARAAWAEPKLGSEFCLMADYDFVLVSCLSDYASALIDRGEVTRAAPLIAESLAIFQRRDNRYEIADCLGTLGILALLQGDLAQANKHLQEAVTIGTAFDHQSMLSTWLPLLGLVTLYNGDAIKAGRLLNEGLRLCLDQKVKYLSARACAFLAETTLWTSKLDQSAEWLTQSLAYDTDTHPITIYEVERLWVAARLATAQQQYQHAATLFGLAEQAHSQIHDAITGPMRSLANAALVTVRAALEPAAFAEAFAAGQQMALAEAFATILAPTSIPGTSVG